MRCFVEVGLAGSISADAKFSLFSAGRYGNHFQAKVLLEVVVLMLMDYGIQIPECVL